MLFRYRPRQTWMPFRVPRPMTQQEHYNLQLQQQYDATKRSTPTAPQTGERDVAAALKDLADLRASGALSDAEFEHAKAAVLGDPPEDG
jgi:Short C-terminal domain